MNETSSARAFRWIVHGRVQGVSYRYFTRQNAVELGLTGWVRNLPDGTVETQFEASAKALDVFRERLLAGPPMGRVDRIDEEELPAADAPRWSVFEIRYT